MKLYVDMDGTIVDFVSQANKYGFWSKDKENKIDWTKVKEMGPRFWVEMDWMPDAITYFERLYNWKKERVIELYILSSIDFEDGREGKRRWIQRNTNFPLENVIFVENPEDKAEYATSDSWLLDDRKKSLEPFKKAGGNIIEFKGDWTEIFKEIENIISDNILATKIRQKSDSLAKKNILFESGGEPAHICATDERDLISGYLIDEDGNYYYKKEVFELQELSECETYILYCTEKLKKQLKYIFLYQSPIAAEKIKQILTKYSKEIRNLPDEMYNPHIMDGGLRIIKFGDKTIKGYNIIEPQNNPYKKVKRPRYIPDSISDEEYERNETNLEIINKIYLEIQEVLKGM